MISADRMRLRNLAGLELGRNMENRPTALWIGAVGQALAEHSIRQKIIERTQVAFGVPISPHLFRDCAAATLALEDPAHVGAAAAILGHDAQTL